MQGTDYNRSPTETYAESPAMLSAGNHPDRIISSPRGDKLMEYFANSGKPPILAEVETEKKWAAMRQAIVDMATASSMVRCAVLAFSNAMLSRRHGAIAQIDAGHYKTALEEVAANESLATDEYSPERERLLAALFLLSYVEIIETRLDTAYAHLKRAYDIFRQAEKPPAEGVSRPADKARFSSAEKQLLLWIRLLDGKAVSAGGDGLFLSKDDELLLVEASPASFDGESDDPAKQDAEGDIEDVLFQVLYQPGIVFYQKVQSFMGRISKIDPWHRSRGTVEDETEVMNIGASIAADLRALYDQRPPLMDYAVAGKLKEPHISARLSFVLGRAFRTYLSNYYASKVHLHRVAYKTLPLTREATEALDQIRKLAKQTEAGLDPDDALPVNMLWPLLMLGVEEKDASEKAWIKAQMLRMERVAGNARITAQVLEEVQARQDAAKTRMDIRSVMLEVFNSFFAIV
jgi:hypothetical protein